ncbi:MAG: thioredoxin family protein [Rickettsiaceae bacterium H1]|nr:thioredoxin family protein [Rickettsiaceae bacterium H1]
MVKLLSLPGKLGSSAIDFDLLGVDSKRYNLQNSRGEKGLLIMFICNHCPYVQQIINKLITDTKDLLKHNIKSIAIMPNDVKKYPQDSLENMQNFSQQKKLSFPYVIDSTQKVAKSYEAVCTPDFFGFDKELKLKYRGRLRGQNNERELFEIMSSKKNNKIKQFPSEGCSIKWIGE